MQADNATPTGEDIADSDETLVRLAAAHDQRSFRVLMHRHMPRAIRLAQRILNDPADADDVGQEAFVRVWNHAPAFDPGKARFTTWLYRIVVNLALDRSRDPRHRPIDDAANVAIPSPAPVDAMIAREQEALLSAAINHLSERQRAAIALFHMEGLSGREAANAMGMSEKAFESLLSRARHSLKQQLEQLEEDPRSLA